MVGFVFQLFDSILVAILEDWITDTDLCNVDNAVCSSNHRQSFLVTLSKCKVIHSRFSKAKTDEFYDWIALRGMGLRKIRIRDIEEVQGSVALNHVFNRTKLIDCLIVSNGKTVVDLIEKYGITILSCELINEATEEDVMMVLKSCPELEGLDISGCSSLTNALCDMICECCPQLKKFVGPKRLNSSKILECCCNLESINCDWNGPATPSPIASRKLLSAEIINNTNSIVVKALVDCCPSLKYLAVGGYFDDEAVVHAVGKCTKLTSLTVSSFNVGDIAAKAISVHARSLKCLMLYDSVVTDEGVLTIVQNLTVLQEFALSGNRKVSDQALFSIATNCKELEFLAVDKCSGVSESGLTEVYQKCNHLQVLSFQMVSTCILLSNIAVGLTSLTLEPLSMNSFSIDKVKVWDEIRLDCCGLEIINFYQTVFPNNPKLKRIELNGLAIDDHVIEVLVASCPLLSHVVLLDCINLTRVVFEHLARCRGLIAFSLRGFHDVTLQDIEQLVHDKPNMLEAILSKCSTVTDDMLRVIARYCPKLKLLNLRNAHQVTSEGVCEVLRCCPELNGLNAIGCIMIDKAVLSSLIGRRMVGLYLTDCDISAEDIAEFKAINGKFIGEFCC